MGTMGPILGGALLGLGAASLTKKPSYGSMTEVHSTMTPSRPETPEPPAATADAAGGEAESNALMEAERERERQQAALRRRQAREVFTSGLGAGGMAATARKSMLGG